jgi:hypothetical protein
VSIRVISYGGGVQSTALLVLAAQRRIDYRTFLFANVGDDSEHPATLAYVRTVAGPYAERHGIEVHELNRIRRDGTIETLYGRLTRPGSRSVGIPVRMSNGAPGRRSCTADFKIRVIGKWLRQHGATATAPAIVGIGISADEIHRANTRHADPWERVVYPLVSIGDDTGLRLTRSACQRLIAEAGVPVPPKSSCYFCPFHRLSTWQNMRREEPELFEKSAELETLLNARRAMLGKDPVWLTDATIPIRDAVQDDSQGILSGLDGSCDSGWCHT